MASPRKEKGSKASLKEKVQRLAGSSGRTAREEEKARSLEREAVHLRARRISPSKKLREEEIEDDALLTDKRKRKRRPQAKKKGKAQPTGSAAHEADTAVDDDGFAYSAISFPYDMISSNKAWCLKGAKGVQEEVEDGTSMILDTGCTKATCNRHAYLLMREGLFEGQVELLPDSSTFNFANGQKALAREKRRIWFSYEPPLFTDFSIIDEGKVPFLMSLPQIKNLGVSLDQRGTPERILFHTGFLKGQGAPLHRNRAGHLTLDVMEICRKIPSQSAQPPIAAEPALPQPAIEKKYRLPSGQKMPATDLYKRADQRSAVRRQPPEVKGQEEKGAEPGAAVLPPVPADVPAKGAPLPPHPPEGEDEVLPERELNLDGLVPPPLVKLYQRLSRRSELLKLEQIYPYKSFTVLFLKKSYHQSLRHQFLLISLLRLMMMTCNLRINHSRVRNQQ